VIPLLEEKGLNVVAVQLPLTSLQDDAAATKRAIELAVKSYGGPILLVGHSYGGTVITEVGNTPDVAGLVFVAAFAPDQGESSLALAMANPTPGGAQLVHDDYQFYKLTQQGIYDDFAQSLSVKEKQKLFVTQGPIGGAALGSPVDAPAWRSKPNWFVVASNDRVISPQLEQAEAQRMNAITLAIPTCHVAMLAEPDLVADFIEDAAKKAGKIQQH
jgi:pimeloyl-ACP methyl ester carboxylesterase